MYKRYNFQIVNVIQLQIIFFFLQMTNTRKLFVASYRANNIFYFHIYFMQLVLSCCDQDDDTIVNAIIHETIIQLVQSRVCVFTQAQI